MIFIPLLFLNLLPILPLSLSALVIGFNTYIFLKEKKVRGLISAYLVIFLIRYTLNLTYLSSLVYTTTESLKENFIVILGEYLKEDKLSFIASITIGKTSLKLSSRIYSLFQKLNLIHVISISGANFSMIYEGIKFLNKFINKKRILVIYALLSTFYILLIGLNNLAAFRAYIFTGINTYSSLVGRPIKLLDKFILSLVFMTLFDTNSITDRSLMLSYGFSIFYTALGSKYLSRIFNNEVKKMSLTFIVSCLIFNSKNPDFIANLTFTILYPIIFILAAGLYISSNFNMDIYIFSDLINTLTEILLNQLNLLTSSELIIIQSIAFIAILIILLKSNLKINLYESKSYY